MLARAGAESHLAPRRCVPCAYSPVANVQGETNSPATMTKKNEERPTEARHWLKAFDTLAGYRHEPSRLFEDYLDLVLCAVANKQREQRYLEVAKRYTREELEVISELFAIHVLVHEHQTTPIDGRGRWYDLLGDIYMDLAGRSKTSRMGQFFTPPALCTMMATMVIDGETKDRTVLDCCAGSGRMLLAAHAQAKDLGILYAADVDPICVKMCALNFWLHGVRGEVAHMNSLSLEWYGAYHVHPRMTWPFVTFLDDSRKDESHLYVRRESVFKAQEERKSTVPDLFSQGEG